MGGRISYKKCQVRIPNGWSCVWRGDGQTLRGTYLVEATVPHLLEKQDERQTSVLENWHRTSEQFIWRFSPDITTIKEEVRSPILVICFPDGQGQVKSSGWNSRHRHQANRREEICNAKKYNPVELIKQISYRHVTSGFTNIWHILAIFLESTLKH